MRKQFADAVDIHDGSFVAVIGRSLYFVKFDFFAYLAGKLVVDGVPRTGGDDASLDGFAYQCQVADDIQQFVAGRFVVPYQGNMVDVAQFGGVHVGNPHDVCQLVVVFLAHLFFVDYDGVVQIASLNQSGTQQWFYFADEYKGTRGSYLGGEFSHVFQCGELIGQYFRLIRDQCIHTEIFVRKNNDGRSGFLVPEFDF